MCILSVVSVLFWRVKRTFLNHKKSVILTTTVWKLEWQKLSCLKATLPDFSNSLNTCIHEYMYTWIHVYCNYIHSMFLSIYLIQKVIDKDGCVFSRDLNSIKNHEVLDITNINYRVIRKLYRNHIHIIQQETTFI